MTDKDSKIRLATANDLEQLIVLLVELFEQEYEFEPDIKAHKKAVLDILSQPQQGQIFVVEHQGQVIAMVSLLYSISTALGGKVAILEDMIVLPDYRQQGFGGDLLDHVIAYAKQNDCLRITLLTDHDNTRAQAFYRTKGFGSSSMHAFRYLIK